MTDISDNKNTEPFLGGNIQKIVSISASIATAHFNLLMAASSYSPHPAQFDSRVFTVPSVEEATNYVIHRQHDTIRNSVAMAAQSVFSHKQLHQKKVPEMKDMLHEKGIDWTTTLVDSSTADRS